MKALSVSLRISKLLYLRFYVPLVWLEKNISITRYSEFYQIFLAVYRIGLTIMNTGEEKCVCEWNIWFLNRMPYMKNNENYLLESNQDLESKFTKNLLLLKNFELLPEIKFCGWQLPEPFVGKIFANGNIKPRKLSANDFFL